MSYSILVIGCDKNLKLLDCFFKYFKRYYDLNGASVYLSLEKKSYTYDSLDITVFNDCDGSPWSKRVKEALKKIDTKAVLVLLDDFIIESKVDTEEIEKLSKLIENDDSIAHFALTTVPMKNDSDEIYYDRYYKRYKFGRYKTTLQAGIWNREELISVLSDKDNAWQTEVYANIRSYLSDRNYYAISDKKLKPIDYNDGLFCVGGKQNEPEVKRLSEKLGEDLHIEGIESNNGIVIRDVRNLRQRIIERICITVYQTVYFLRYWGKKVGKKN